MKKTRTKSMTLVGLMTALICIIAPFSIPLPFSPVPISLSGFIIFMAIYIEGVRYATYSCILYLLIGSIGLPVFAGFAGGISKLAGPTGGYLIGYILMTLVSGRIIAKDYNNKYKCIFAMVAGTAICYLLGTVWLSVVSAIGIREAFMVGVALFIPGDIVKIIMAAIIGPVIRKRLTKAGLI